MELTRNRLTEIFARYADLKIALVGDLFLDQWFEIDPSLNEISLETGKTAHQVVGRRTSPGAGGNVLSNLAAMGAGKLWAISLIGHDGGGWELLRLLKERGIDVSRILWSDAVMTPSYIKPMNPTEGERFDIKNFTTTPTELENELIDRLQTVAAEADAVILLDQVCEPDCGVITERVRAAAAKAAEANPDTLFIADSRAFAHAFRNVILKCNNFEAAELSGRVADENEFNRHEIFACMDDIETLTGRPVIITCNRHGIAVRDGGEQRILPAVRFSGPIDVCGAGDACTAAFAMSLCAGASMTEAAEIANLAAGVTVRKLNETGTATQAEMLAMLSEQQAF